MPETSSRTSLNALQRGVQALLQQQAPDGSWEGEVVWCPMLAAQYALMQYITQTPTTAAERKLLLRQFAATRLPDGLWGLHDRSQPYLFVTALVYIAARVLGIEPDDPLLVPARQFIRQQGGAIAIPSWGKFWLAMLNLYDWRGVNPVLPEVWRLPRWLPVHPANYYCHTRLIYAGMAYIYGLKFQVTVNPLIEKLRSELYVRDYATISFAAARSHLREAEVYSPPGLGLRLFYHFAAIFDRWHWPQLRTQILADILDCIRFELQTTDYTSISPVSGLLNLISLWLHDPEGEDLKKARDRFSGWMWQDEENGLRIAGARSSTWDTSFAIQALEAASPHVDVSQHLERSRSFLATQQIQTSLPNSDRYCRIDPQGGFCFAGVWHGWPVSDCTAEALLALLNGSQLSGVDFAAAISFLLRCQNRDGGFGSYERRKIASTLEWLNPAEMFANSMTEYSYVECTASCLAALDAFRQRYLHNGIQPSPRPIGHPSPKLGRGVGGEDKPVDPKQISYQIFSQEIDSAIRRGKTWLRKQQHPDGSWAGFWGVNFIYGTMFGIQGLLAGREAGDDAAIAKACDWLVSKQRTDGGWGEHFQGCLTGKYIEHNESQVIHTAWALKALLEAKTDRDRAIEKGVDFLVRSQLEDGSWPKQDPAGVFFKTAVLDYVLYRSYFPVWALGLYESNTLTLPAVKRTGILKRCKSLKG
jgi:lanosterol synthase